MQSHAAVKAEPVPRKEVTHEELVAAVDTIWQHSVAAKQHIEELQVQVAQTAQIAQRVEVLAAANEALTHRVTQLEGGWSDWDNYRDYWHDTMMWVWSAFSASILRWSRPRELHSAPEDSMQDTV